MQTIHVLASEPSVARLLRAAGAAGHCRDAELEAAEHVTLQNTYWDGGTRYAYSLVALDTANVLPLPRWDPPQFGGPRPFQTLPLPEGAALVEVEQGGRKSVRVFVHPSRMAPLLPAPSTLTRDELIVLAATVGLKSSYAGVKDYRFHEAHKTQGIDRAEWDTAKAALIARKLLNAAGAITNAGRNAVGNARIDTISRLDP